MPTFKQFAFFRHAAAHLKRVPYVGKIDDDTAVNLRVLHPMLLQLRCFRHALIGSIQWSAFIPRAELSGIRGDRCAFGWEMYGALRDYAKPFGANGTRTFRPSCDAQAAVLPLPYAAGVLDNHFDYYVRDDGRVWDHAEALAASARALRHRILEHMPAHDA